MRCSERSGNMPMIENLEDSESLSFHVLPDSIFFFAEVQRHRSFDFDPYSSRS
jgi:hypothetical protein